ncbi:hypothetical protein BSLG_010851 [Batrachochytrium salamandrivorans]|nr:hypothetical protein BSLG_010851 [Batrachochytrium salamandrivorans]
MFGPALTLVLALSSSAVIAVPTFNNVYKRAATSLDPSSTEFPFYFPESVYESIPHSGDAPSPSSEEDDAKTATDFISKRLNLGADDFKAAAHVNNGEVTFFSSSFGTTQHLAKRDLAVSEPKATLSFEEVSSTVSAKLEIPVYSEFEHTLEYVAQSDGKVVYSYKFQLRDNPLTRVIKFPRRDPTEGFSMITNPEFKGSSPKGWTAGKVTEGNNVITSNPRGKPTRPIRRRVFNRKFHSTESVSMSFNVAAVAVNLFYVANVMHDISYRYGFTESAGNFQKDNFGKGGKGNDAVVINVLNLSKFDSADFMTPPDGHSAVMNMYRFTRTDLSQPWLGQWNRNPQYAHGISHRLTGGASSGWCLSNDEARGMGEGWSDVMALIVLAKSSDTATTGIPIGAYSKNNAAGLRSYPYTTSMWYNPSKYSYLWYGSQPHYVGTVWASMLWEVYWNLVSKHGFSTNLYDASQPAGNIVAMKIIIGAMMLQPCNPTFLSARDAIVAADALHYQGANKCDILKGFAKRGLGFKATSSYSNDFSLPPECQ